MRLRT
jgi:hypothetical protein